MNAQITAELHRIAGKHGGKLRPVDVVREARAKSSPLHCEFVWDDSVAGHRYRIWQARQLISVTVEYIGGGDETKLHRVFVSLTSDRSEQGGGYRTINAVLADPDHRQRMLADAMEEMERFQEKFSGLKELVRVFAAMRKVRAARKHAAA
jgi:hypothetical protein